MGTVREWAGRRGFDYVAADPTGLPPAPRAGTSRIRFADARRLLRQTYDRVVCLAPDVLVFHPELFEIDIYDEHAFARAAPVARARGAWVAEEEVDPTTLVCVKGGRDFAARLHLALMHLTRRFGVHRVTEQTIQIAERIVLGRVNTLQFGTLDSIGRLGNDVVLALAGGRDDPVAAQAIRHGTPVFAARLGIVDGPPVAAGDVETAIDRLLETRGDPINRCLLESSNSVLRTRNSGMAALFPHETLVRLQFKQYAGYDLNLDDPQTFNERVTTRKLLLTDDIYRRTADKHAVREFVEQRVGAEVLIPRFQVYNRAEDIDFDALPGSFVLKPTHGSGWKLIVDDKRRIDPESVCRLASRWLHWNYFDHRFEVQYRNIQPRIVAEQLLRSSDGGRPQEVRLQVFGGRVTVISSGQRPRSANATITRFDRSWRRLTVLGRRPAGEYVPRPNRLPEMIRIAEALARDFEFARVDLYLVDDRIYFGEITHTPLAGHQVMKPAEFDTVLGRIWKTGEPIPDKYYAAAPTGEAEGVPRPRSIGRTLRRGFLRLSPLRLQDELKARVRSLITLT